MRRTAHTILIVLSGLVLVCALALPPVIGQQQSTNFPSLRPPTSTGTGNYYPPPTTPTTRPPSYPSMYTPYLPNFGRVGNPVEKYMVERYRPTLSPISRTHATIVFNFAKQLLSLRSTRNSSATTERGLAVPQEAKTGCDVPILQSVLWPVGEPLVIVLPGQ